MTTFTDLKLSAPLLQALATEGYETPTPIQAQAIPALLEGRDLLGIAQTGTGKTAAFALPLLQRLTTTDRRAAPRSVRALILTPTRELAVQILDSFRSYGRHLRLSRFAIYGGVSQGPQVQALSRGIDVLIATPGRLLDLMNQGQVKFDGLEAFVLDEADRMLDMGFILPVKRIVAKLPQQRQTLMFSATMPQAVQGLVNSLLKEPVRVEVTPVATTAERIAQRVLFVEKANKRPLLESLMGDKSISRALVFTRTKHGANKVAESLGKAGVRADAIHGNKSQNARQKALNDFRSGKVRVLVATDIAARGIDVDGVTHVINFDLPNEPESYVHRIGRTARAGNEGIAISFCDGEERAYLRDIEKTIRQAVPVDAGHPFHAAHIAEGKRGGSAPQARGGGRNAHASRGEPRQERRPERHQARNAQIHAEEATRRDHREDRSRSDQPRRSRNDHPHPHARPQEQARHGHRDEQGSQNATNHRGHRQERDHAREDRPQHAHPKAHRHAEGRGGHGGSNHNHRAAQNGEAARERPRQDQPNRAHAQRPAEPRVDGRGGDAPLRRSNGQQSAKPHGHHGQKHRGHQRQGGQRGQNGQRSQRFEPVRMG
ncbi:MAG TPA: DEAD/DEAH box helicase [Dongiaceae bacterium]|nr:DEAD/DEAH box helicase [Dongiaceae bacterium]